MSMGKLKTMSAIAGIGDPMTGAAGSGWVSLNARQRCDEASDFEQELFRRIVAQDDAVLALSQIYQVYLAKMTMPNKPLGALLFLGPTGSGKTRSVEAAAEVLFGDSFAMVKVDCAEFQHSHEISKLIGSPPGYLGHRETRPVLTQEMLDRNHTPRNRLTFVLFDEIEKASDALWQLLLGVLDKARITLGDNRTVDFSSCVIVMTSNLGAREMAEVTEGKLGFTRRFESAPELDAKIEKIGVEAARRKFSPEFINRLDKIVVFRSLTQESLRRILDIEFQIVQRRVLMSGAGNFALSCAERTKDFLLAEGFDRRYGTRPLKRAIERHLVIPLSNLIATKQIEIGDMVCVDVDESGRELCFKKKPSSSAMDWTTSRFGAFMRPLAA
ncbi:MAG TPA: AAA family ATPase [Blastocatellia bacterium]|nr:AAA family ATPase [Blastocatellia bacterium]